MSPLGLFAHLGAPGFMSLALLSPVPVLRRVAAKAWLTPPTHRKTCCGLGRT